MGAIEARADTLLLVPEPTDWLHPLLASVMVGSRQVRVFAPWALPPAAIAVGQRVGFVRRRAADALPGARGNPWFTAAELLTRAHARGRSAQTFANRVRMRRLADHLGALAVSRGPAPDAVIAPSFAARRTFAAAKRRGCTCILVEDMPDFDSLVDGLNALSRRYPHARFLRNHRPTARDHARQRAERWQADVIAVRGRIGWHRLGAAQHRVLLSRTPGTAAAARGKDVCFAGPPLARAGSMHLPALLDALPGHTIRVQPGPCSEPSTLLQHPRLTTSRTLDGAGVVLSISPLESHPGPVAAALDCGLPVVGTPNSTGLLDPASVSIVDPHDVDATAKAVDAALRGESPRPAAWKAPMTLQGWFETQYSTASSVTP